MRLRPSVTLVAMLAAAVLPACVGKYKSDFSVVIMNKAPNTIEVQANASVLGQVAAGQSATFTIRLTETNANEFSNGVAPTPQSQVSFSAKDLKTGVLSTIKSLTLSGGGSNYVTFEASDFPVTTQTVARFTFSPTSPGINENVSFSASTSTVFGAGVFRWDFGDGTTDTGVTVQHRFPREGTYNVVLTATSDNGQSSTASRTVTITSTLPPSIANFTFSPSAPAVNQEVYFNASTSGVSTGTFAWDFGDGGTTTGVSVSHRFVRAGTYTVTLRVTNSAGQSGVASRAVTVTNTSPQVVANFTFSPTNPSINQTIYFNASASTPSTATFRWDFGDGENGSGVMPTHAYDFAGIYSVTLTVTNDVGQSASVSRTVVVQATSPQVTASFVFSPTSPGVNQEVLFNASASRPLDGNFSWSFGDGSPAGTGVMPTHRYTQAGTYTVTLTVANGLGQTATTSRTVTVTNTSSNVTASFTFSPTAPAVNQFVYFDASASRPTTASFAWNFGDGSPPDSGVNPTHRFAVAGTFTVTLTVSNAEGQMATATRTVTVTNTSSSVTASFSFSPTAPTAGQTVFFNASASRPTTGKFEWDFGDGTAGTGMLPSRVYAQPGTYTVTLRVSDDAGQSATTTRIVTVSPTTLTADFTFSPTDPTISRGTNTVRFDATPSSAGVTTWTWDYGDGAAVETGQQVSHTFTRVGTWVVRLTVGDGTGRTATVTKNVTVSP